MKLSMNWDQLISTRRLGSVDHNPTTDSYNRTQFQRDYDRLIFSSPFRRMQNKTQVFPLPGSIFVHNRLTHSLEVASVGRSLGNILSDRLYQSGETNPLLGELGAIVSAACLAHDMGNPPFGHAGEEAISNYFKNESGKCLQSKVTDKEWKDFLFFDGNANALRLLSHQFQGRRPGGFALTYTTLSAIVKYPFESGTVAKQKFGFFQSEKSVYHDIARELGLKQISSEPNHYVRHPLVFLVEAADDICYQLMDIEDAHKLKIINYDTVKNLFLNFYDETEDRSLLNKIDQTFKAVTDPNEQIAYLRAGVINKLVHECLNIFCNKMQDIFSGKFQGPLIKELNNPAKNAIQKIQQISIKEIYQAQSVLKIETAGYQILGTLLDEFITAVLNPQAGLSRRLLALVPEQYRGQHQTNYEKIQSILDFVSGMTDPYALDLYRTIKGINLPSFR